MKVWVWVQVVIVIAGVSVRIRRVLLLLLLVAGGVLTSKNSPSFFLIWIMISMRNKIKMMLIK